jgi:hypothetical protein
MNQGEKHNLIGMKAYDGRWQEAPKQKASEVSLTLCSLADKLIGLTSSATSIGPGML